MAGYVFDPELAYANACREESTGTSEAEEARAVAEVRWRVEHTDPHTEHPHLTDEEETIAGHVKAAEWIEARCGARSEEVAQELEQVGEFLHVDPESGIETSAWRAV